MKVHQTSVQTEAAVYKPCHCWNVCTFLPCRSCILCKLVKKHRAASAMYYDTEMRVVT